MNQKIASHSLASADDVVGAIYDAASHGSDRLRYVVGKDAGAIINVRHEKSEQEFRRPISSEVGLAQST